MLPEKTWKTESVLRLLLGWITTLCFGSLIAGIVIKLNPEWSDEKISLFSLIINTVFFQGTALVWIYFFLKGERLSWENAFGFNLQNKSRVIVLGTVAALLVLPVAFALQQFVIWIMTLSDVHLETQEPVRELQSSQALSFRQIYLALVTLVAAPVSEELLFRGILYPTIKRAGFPKLALWITSILFALSHRNMAAFVPLLFFAIILVLLYEETGNLLAPITAHFCFNAANFVMLIWQIQIFQFFT